MRHLPAPASLPTPTPMGLRLTGTLRLLTPLYKGGVDPVLADLFQPFRGPSLRGQLRYWWRATSHHTSVDSLRKAERELFGGVFGSRAQASRVRVGVLKQSSDGMSKQDLLSEDLDYLLWTCRNPTDRAFHKPGATGQLMIEGPRNEGVEVALRAMVLCGGLGSRSRRGLGSVWLDCPEIGMPKNAFSTIEEYLSVMHALVPTGGARPWPTLARARLLRGPLAPNASTALRALANAMQEVRSYKNKNRPKQFQSTWLDVMRGQAQSLGFTAALGLPIQYQTSSGHFNGKRSLRGFNRDRRKADRLPSPIIFRVIPIQDRFLPVMLVLPVPFPERVELSGSGLPPLSGRVLQEGLEVFISAVAAKKMEWQLESLGGTK